MKASESSSSSDTDTLSSTADPAEGSDATSMPSPFRNRDPLAVGTPSPKAVKAAAVEDGLESGGNLEKVGGIIDMPPHSPRGPTPLNC